jgi:integrase
MNAATKKKGTYTSGKPCWMVQAFVAGKRIRRYFCDEEKADEEVDRINKSSVELLDVPERIIHEGWQCHKRLEENGWTLTRATEYVLEHVIKFQEQASVRQLVEKYLEEEEASELAQDTIRDLRSRLKKFSRRFGDRKAHEISIEEVREWLIDMTKVEGLGPRSRCHYLSKASQFFRWCVVNKRCAENPVAAVKRPKVISGEIEFYDIAQCRRLLELASKHGLYHYVVLGLFPGIRPTELSRMHRSHTRMDRRIIILNAEVTKKTRRRVIEMPVEDAFGDCLFSWLSTGPIPEKVFAASHSTFRRKFRELRDSLDFKLIQDGLRHTAATYHFAYCGDAAKTAALLGERDIRTLLEHYKGLASKADAEQFYALRPEVANGDSTAIGKDIDLGQSGA